MKLKTAYFSAAILIAFATFPLFFQLPFRIHLDLPWEGAYRLYLGQKPYQDFGMPLGYGFFIFPWLCFHVFGPYLSSLLYSQVVVTLLSGASFCGILYKCGLESRKILLSLWVFCLSYTFLYFWPWYNNTALTYELCGIFCLLHAFEQKKKSLAIVFTVLAAICIFLTFFTKQDYGGLAFIFGAILVGYQTWLQRKYTYVLAYFIGYVAAACVIVLPVYSTDFIYWFNLGQPPHQNRLKLLDILNEIFLNSAWEKFYIVCVLCILLYRVRSVMNFLKSRQEFLFFLICVGIIVQALVTKSTSGQSLGNTTYYHGFAIAYLLYYLPYPFGTNKNLSAVVLMIGTFLWFSGEYWKYAGRIFHFGNEVKASSTAPTKAHPDWVSSPYKAFNGTKLPVPTIEGIAKIKSLKLVSSEPTVLNMTELTPLAYELRYTPQKSLPLWYHLNIGMFQKQVDTLCNRVVNEKYDLVLFEKIPSLDNYFPEQVRDSLKVHYHLQDTFFAPRKEGDSFIEVYVRK